MSRQTAGRRLRGLLFAGLAAAAQTHIARAAKMVGKDIPPWRLLDPEDPPASSDSPPAGGEGPRKD